MPIDRKRINGPEESVPYELFARLRPKDSDKIPIEKNANIDGIIQEDRKICTHITEFIY